MNKNKRVDRRSGGLIPALSRPEDKRRLVRGEAKKWTAADEAVLVAAVAACKSRTAYEMMSFNLLQAIGHAPVYPKMAHPTVQKVVQDSVRAIELRVVTKMLAGGEPVFPYTQVGTIAKCRDKKYEPLTWGERVKLIRPYLKRREDDRIGSPEFREMIGRCDSAYLVFSYFEEIEKNPNIEDEEQLSAVVPVTAKKLSRLRQDIEELRASDKEERTFLEACIYNLLTKDKYYE